MLRLQAECGAAAVGFAPLAVNAAVQEIGRIELQPRLSREHLEHASRFRIGDSSRQTEAGARAVQDVVMVIPFTKLDLFVVRINPRPDQGRFSEIERSILDLAKLARRNQRAVDGGEAVGVDHDFVLQDVARCLPRPD